MDPFKITHWEGDRRRRLAPLAGREVHVDGVQVTGTLTGVVGTDGAGNATVVRVAFEPARWKDVGVDLLEFVAS